MKARSSGNAETRLLLFRFAIPRLANPSYTMTGARWPINEGQRRHDLRWWQQLRRSPAQK